jgi:hypothetical protein
LENDKKGSELEKGVVCVSVSVRLVETKSYFDVLKITNSINYISIQF